LEAVERANTAAATAQTAARDVTQTAACEKAVLEVKVLELERDLGTATSDLATTSRQFSQATNQLQVATEEAARLRDANIKLSQDLDSKLGGPLFSLFGFPLAPCRALTCRSWLQGHA
jgi:chromosome segregation ATPase